MNSTHLAVDSAQISFYVDNPLLTDQNTFAQRVRPDPPQSLLKLRQTEEHYDTTNGAQANNTVKEAGFRKLFRSGLIEDQGNINCKPEDHENMQGRRKRGEGSWREEKSVV